MRIQRKGVRVKEMCGKACGPCGPGTAFVRSPPHAQSFVRGVCGNVRSTCGSMCSYVRSVRDSSVDVGVAVGGVRGRFTCSVSGGECIVRIQHPYRRQLAPPCL
jgi:hypothetical protein